MTDGKQPDDAHFDYAEPQAPLTYEPFRQSDIVPDWKDPQRRYKKLPVRDYGAAMHVDKEIYWSPEVKEQEWQRVFKKSWLFVGHISDLPEPGCFMKADRGHESFLIVRGENDQLKAMYNFCSHRGNQIVLQDFGFAKKFVCPFHKWEFSTDGELTKIVDRETFRKAAICGDLSLPQVRVESWRGWIFINMDKNAEPLETFLGEDFIKRAEAYEFDGLIRVRDVEQVWPANWKTVREIFEEGYHVQATHPQFRPAVDAYHTQVDLFDHGHALSVFPFMSPSAQYKDRLAPDLALEHKIFLREAGVPEAEWPSHWRDVPQVIIKAKRKKTKPIDYSRFTDGQLIDDWNASLFPTTELFYHPEGYFVQHWWPHPTDPEKCIYQTQVYAIPGMTELPSFMGVENADLSGKEILPRTYLPDDNMVDLGPVISQDRAMVPRLQRALHSDGFRGSVYSEQEVRIRHFQNEYYRLMQRPRPSQT